MDIIFLLELLSGALLTTRKYLFMARNQSEVLIRI